MASWNSWDNVIANWTTYPIRFPDGVVLSEIGTVCKSARRHIGLKRSLHIWTWQAEAFFGFCFSRSLFLSQGQPLLRVVLTSAAFSTSRVLLTGVSSLLPPPTHNMLFLLEVQKANLTAVRGNGLWKKLWEFGISGE